MNFLLRSIFATSHGFWYVVFLLSFISRYFKFLLLFLSWSIDYSVAHYLISTFSCFFSPFFFLWMILVSYHCDWRSCFDIISFFFEFIKVCFVTWHVLENGSLVKYVYSSVFWRNDLYVSVQSMWSNVLLSLMFPCWFSEWSIHWCKK